MTWQSDQLSGSADNNSKPVRMRHRQEGVGRAPWQESMNISYEIGSTHNRQFPRHLTGRAVALMNVTIVLRPVGKGDGFT